MKFRSVFDVIGPVMLGPSSSHTAGAVRIGQIARKLFEREPEKIVVQFYGSFAKTYRGHATDVAVVGGVLGMDVADPLLPESLSLAAKLGIMVELYAEEQVPEHPNTVRITLTHGSDTLDVTGISIGGGAVQITEYASFPIKLSGEQPTILILHQDSFGVIAQVTNCLEKEEINIAHMEVSRLSKGDRALMLIETDEMVPSSILSRMAERKNIIKVSMLDVHEI